MNKKYMIIGLGIVLLLSVLVYFGGSQFSLIGGEDCIDEFIYEGKVVTSFDELRTIMNVDY